MKQSNINLLKCYIEAILDDIKAGRGHKDANHIVKMILKLIDNDEKE